MLALINRPPLKIVVWGHGSLWVHIPDDIADRMGWKSGTPIDLEPQDDGSILITTTKRKDTDNGPAD